MKKRALATALWAFSGWYLGAFVAWAFDLGPALSPILATAFALIVGGDPRHVIWSQRTAQTLSQSSDLTAQRA